jgi:hypothetical protein
MTRLTAVNHRLSVVIAAALLLVVATPAAAARPPQGHYKGSAGGGFFAFNVVDGDWLYNMKYRMRLNCPNGSRPTVTYVTDFSGFEDTGPRISRRGLIRFHKTSLPPADGGDNQTKAVRISGRLTTKRRRGSRRRITQGKGRISIAYQTGPWAGCTTGSVVWRVRFRRRLSFDQVIEGYGLGPTAN